MPAGTLVFTNGSNSVTGTGTTLTADVEATDFIIVVIGGTSYMVGVTSVESDTGLTLVRNFDGPTTGGLTYRVVPVQTMQLITSQLSADTSRAFRELFLDKSNWQAFYASTGDITITLPDGTSVTGPGWPEMQSDLSGKAGRGANSDITSLSGLTTALSIAQGGTGATTKAAAVTALGGFGTAAGNFAQGNDSRFGTVDSKSGGSISSGITVSGRISGNVFFTSAAGSPLTQGTWIGWNGAGISGGSDFMNNRGSGDGGFVFNVVNSANSSVITQYKMLNNGQGQSSAGWAAVCDEGAKNYIKEIDPEKALNAVCSWRTATWQYADTPAEFDENGKVTEVVKGALGVGYIAQDVQKDCPEAVTVIDQGSLYVTPEGELYSIENMLSLNTTGAAAGFQGAAIKALKKRNEDQAELISALLKRLEAVETNLGINGEPAS